MGFNFAPRGWAFCDGQLLSISQNTALFSLVGTFYGGDGRTTFALPDLRGRTPVHVQNGPGLFQLGQRAGLEAVALLAAEMPNHSHNLVASASASLPFDPPTEREGGNPANHVLSANSDFNHMRADNPATRVGMRGGLLSSNGGGQFHGNMQPYSVVSFCISLLGVFPSRS